MSLGTVNVANGSNIVLSSTNITTPLLNWIPVSSNQFDASGHFLITNPANPTQPQECYRLVEP